jgi:hypothetical protein
VVFTTWGFDVVDPILLAQREQAVFAQKGHFIAQEGHFIAQEGHFFAQKGRALAQEGRVVHAQEGHPVPSWYRLFHILRCLPVGQQVIVYDVCKAFFCNIYIPRLDSSRWRFFEIPEPLPTVFEYLCPVFPYFESFNVFGWGPSRAARGDGTLLPSRRARGAGRFPVFSTGESVIFDPGWATRDAVRFDSATSQSTAGLVETSVCATPVDNRHFRSYPQKYEFDTYYVQDQLAAILFSEFESDEQASFADDTGFHVHASREIFRRMDLQSRLIVDTGATICCVRDTSFVFHAATVPPRALWSELHFGPPVLHGGRCHAAVLRFLYRD